MVAVDLYGESMPEVIERVVRPLLTAEGYDLVLVEHIGPSRILRLYIDKLDAPVDPKEGIGIEDCSRVSRWVSDVLDNEGVTEAIAGPFNLEVSSPGLDRPLVRPRDYCRFVGSEIRVAAHRDAAERFAGRRRFTGMLRGADTGAEGGIRLEVDGRVFEIGYGMIEQARLVPQL